MTCSTIVTGDAFLSRVLAHIDCQAQVVGSYGYQALGQPGSVAATFMAGLLTLFVIVFGLRLMFGRAPGARDLVSDVLMIGIVVTLAFSWPAFRTVIYDVTLKAPAEVASALSSPSAPSDGLVARLQAVDNGIVELTTVGTGRLAGQVIDESVPGNNFEGIALQDRETLGSARLAYLASTIGVLGLLRVTGGLLLALAPLVAGLLLFVETRAVFAGWAKGLVFVFAGSIGATIVLSVQLAILEPLISDALQVRRLGYATPSTPTELLATSLAFLLVHIGVIVVLSRIAFYRGWLNLPTQDAPLQIEQQGRADFPMSGSAATVGPTRIESITNSFRSNREGDRMLTYSSSNVTQTSPSGRAHSVVVSGPGNEAARSTTNSKRSSYRHSRSSERRDNAA